MRLHTDGVCPCCYMFGMFVCFKEFCQPFNCNSTVLIIIIIILITIIIIIKPTCFSNCYASE